MTSTAAANKPTDARGSICFNMYFTTYLYFLSIPCTIAKNSGGFIMSKSKNKTNVRKKANAKYDAKRQGQRTRNWTALVYPEDVAENWVEKMDGVKWVQSPLHDKDTNPDGTPKKAHYHVLLMFSAVKTFQQVFNYLADRFGTTETAADPAADGEAQTADPAAKRLSIIGVALPQMVSDRSALVRYFAHLDNPSKHQYNVADITAHGGADVLELLQHNKREIACMLIDIEQFIDDNNITELCDLSLKLRGYNIEWYLIVTTQHTYYFNAYLRSRRHKLLAAAEAAAAEEHCLRLVSAATAADPAAAEE